MCFSTSVNLGKLPPGKSNMPKHCKDTISRAQRNLEAKRTLVEYNFYKEGDFIMAGLISAHGKTIQYAFSQPFHCVETQVDRYRSILSFILAVDEINNNPDLLPNITLGYHIVDTCGDPIRSIQAVFQILSGRDKENNAVPNYSCMAHGEVAGFLDDSTSGFGQGVAELLSLYKYTQIIYEAADPHLSRVFYQSLYKFAPIDRTLYESMVKCLKYFGWNWIGIIRNEQQDEADIKELYKVMAENEICIAFIGRVTEKDIRREITEVQKSGIMNNLFDDQNGYEHHFLTYSNLRMLQIMLHRYVGNVHYTDPNGMDIFFNDRGEVPFPWTLVNWVEYGSENKTNLAEQMIAIFNGTQENLVENIHPEKIKWKNNRMPQSRCNDRCSPGYRKAPNGGYHVCCYNCVPCSAGEMSNMTDSDICYKCPEEEWPDEKKVTCVPKSYQFLSYEKDILVSVFVAMVLFLSAVTLFILGIFIYHWDTPIVKANNRTVSFILLVSILLGFLSVFFFLGRPVDITCLLRQISFGIFFSIAVSSLLAKTLLVCVAFKASKPGSIWRKWLAFNVSYYGVFICSFVQVLICLTWCLVSPPYVEFDHDTYPGKILIQCNEGSDIWFYSMLGYMGFLAAVSFVLAFMVRTLPDSYNEAKYITFSMLVFCSVWIAMIPAYLSTRGKYMVAVEIFAILTSCAASRQGTIMTHLGRLKTMVHDYLRLNIDVFGLGLDPFNFWVSKLDE
ncbi:vomeronasal type-2 receptor 26-like [Dendropsophus ebraccatus]|uniref:vomeronasal type-2 receptor 26-like n=1 Tax=Dendropsophus ebraccatus TaxID=150705 RepID=UPI00383133A6